MPGPRSTPHIVHVFPGFDVGGSQVRFAAIAAGLGGRFSHSIIALNGRQEAFALLEPGLGARMSPAPEIRGGLTQRYKAMRAELDRLSPDLLVTYNWGAMDVALANFGRRTPHIHVEDGFGPEEALRQFPRRVWTRRLALSRSDVVAPSATLDKIATGLWRLNRRRVHWIPNGVAEQNAWSTALADLDLNLPSGRPIVTWVGAMRAEKNPVRLVRAFAALKAKAVLLMIGDGPQRAEVQSEVERLGLGDDVRLLGHRTDARDLVMQSDILALSSDTEQMPLVALEGMDAGLTIVSTDVGDVRGMVAPLNHPFIVKSEDELASALVAAVENAELRKAIGHANRARCRDQYSLTGMQDAWRGLFDRLTAKAV